MKIRITPPKTHVEKSFWHLCSDLRVFGITCKYFLVSALFAGICSTVIASGLSDRIEKIINKKKLTSVNFGIVIADTNSGSVLYSHNADAQLTPASNMKLVTSWAAIKALGADYNFVTEVGLLGSRLVIIGSGDPLLGDPETDSKYGRADGWVIKKIIDTLKDNGTEKIDGITVDSSVFDDNMVCPNWPADQLNRPYACQVSGLNYNANCVRITAQRTGPSVSLEIEPQTSYVKLINKIKTSDKSGNAIGSYRNSTPNLLTVFGKCRTRASFDVAIERPAAFFGILLAENLARAGIQTAGTFREEGLDTSDIQLLVRFVTPLTDCLARCNKDSFALAAESLLKTIAARKITARHGGSRQAGTMVITEYLNGLGIDPNEYCLDDGCGLSRKDKLSANLISKALLDACKSDYWPVLKQSLAIGGVDGTIRRYFWHSRYKGKVFAKSGYINGVRALSGVCVKDNNQYAFAILANHANGYTKQAIHDIVKTIIDY